MSAETRLCRRCWRPARADRMVRGYGSDCARMLGLTGSAPDLGQDGPDLLELLAATDETSPAGANGEACHPRSSTA